MDWIRHAKPPFWFGQATAGLPSASVAAVAVVWMASSSGPNQFDDGETRVASRTLPRPSASAVTDGAAVTGSEAVVVFVVGASADTELLAASLNGERLVRGLRGERARESQIVVGDGLDLDLFQMALSGDDAMLNAPPSVVFVDLR